jgi:large subunit ribosomal protein L24
MAAREAVDARTATGRVRSLSLKKGDLVRVITGKRADRGREGRIIDVDPLRQRVIVEGVNRITKHTKASPGQAGGSAGGIVVTEAPLHVSNVALVVEVDGKKVPTRIGHKRVSSEKTRADGSTYTAWRSVRVARKTGEEI